MKFGNTLAVFNLLWIGLGLLLLYIHAFRRKKRLAEKFASSALLERLVVGKSSFRLWTKGACLIVAFMLMVLALARPQYGEKLEEVKRRGVDIVIALDVSRSMLAEDVSPTRLERAKRKIMDLLEMLEGDRVALVGFAGVAFVHCPLTLDYGALRLFMDYLDSDLIPVPGTAIGDAIKKSLEAFSDNKHKSKAVILITDGEDHEGKPLEAAKEARKEGVKIFTIGIGQDIGAPVPANAGKQGFKKDTKGEMVISKLNERMLQEIALETGGDYVRSVTGDLDLETIYRKGIKKKLEDVELGSEKRHRYEDRYQIVLVLVLLLMMLEFLINERKVPRKSGRSFLRSPFSRKKEGDGGSNGTLSAILIFLALSALLMVPVEAFATVRSKTLEGISSYNEGRFEESLKSFVDAQIEAPMDSSLMYNTGNVHHRMKNYDEAMKSYQEVVNSPSEPALKQKAWYNMGNTAYYTGKLDQAVQYYLKSLELNPDDMDAKKNLEFVRNEIRKRLNEAEKTKKQCKNKQDQQKDKQDKGQQNQGGGQSQSKENPEQSDQKKDEREEDKGGYGLKDEQEEEKPGGKMEEKKEEKGTFADMSKGEKKKMDEQEARMWLDSLKEDKAKFMKRSMRGRKRPFRAKDW